ncbi:FAD-dependent oxidoreductase [Mycolicibacter hiberniae]|uniref:FAD-binding protein n=1 Tax=Mycolicibacter hiberniae TaxID=29314 RepID=A0A7I7X3L4_9MYCO|nr:FAD-dependent oxidoreductase [Mycolicibacter hiberniae]MCV7086402.1 FAD-dependent oxidoreductase [Mycolicibacter hiberniae]ORV69521.1 FAD-binding protein [Mycolicibacter hiberniae]BBZ24439.1 FAD-binding protein [Mycolicibacter hiberniae]
MTTPDWDDSVDVVVLGSGAAGLTAAVTAAVHGASVALYEKSQTVGGTTAVSGGIAWIPAHDRMPGLTVDAAMDYLRAQSLGAMDDELVAAFVRTGPEMVDFVEAHSDVRFEVATGFPDYKPELPGGRPAGGRSLSPLPYDISRVGCWRDRITSFPADYSNVGFDAETRARLHADIEADAGGDLCVAGTALIAGLLRGALDAGITPATGCRGVELLATEDGRVGGVRIEAGGSSRRVRARRAVILANGGFEWDTALVEAFLRGPMRGAVSPPNNTGDGLRMAMARGADLANMGEAWWVPIVRIPGDTIDGHQRSRSVRLERTRPRSIIVNRAGRRFVNEACDYNSMAGAFHYLEPRGGYVNDPAWIVFDAEHLRRYGFLGVAPGGAAPDWFCGSPDLAALAAKTGIDADGLMQTVTDWNSGVAAGGDPEFGRGSSAYDGYWGDPQASTVAGRTLGPIDTAPFYAVPLSVGAMGTKGGPRTDCDGRVLHVSGGPIPGLFAAGNAMAGVTGRAYGGAGGTIGPAMVFGYRAGRAAADPGR